MEVRHKASKAVESASEKAGSRLAGAKLLRAQHDDDPDMFVPFDINKLKEVLDGKDEDDFVLGETDAEIQAVLEGRHPAPGGMTFVYKTSVSRRYRKEHGCYSRHRWDNKHVEGWVIARRPVCLANDTATYKELSTQHGALFIPCSHGNDLSETDFNAAGFTLVDAGSFWQINYNPRAIELRPHHVKRREMKKRLRGYFPKDVLHGLYAMIHTDNWPHDHPFRDVVRALDLTETRGWGNTANLERSVGDILDLLALNRKVFRKRWWRDSARNSYGPHSQIEAALPYLHGVEDQARTGMKNRLEEIHRDWLEYVEDFKERPEEFDTDEPITFEEYRPDYQERAKDCEALRLCRWIRAEARAMKVKMPRKPVMPTLRKKKRKRKKKRRKSARSNA